MIPSAICYHLSILASGLDLTDQQRDAIRSACALLAPADNPREHAARLRCDWVNAVSDLSEEDRRAEIRQVLIDLMDVTEQSDLEEDVIRASDAFEGKDGAR